MSFYRAKIFRQAQKEKLATIIRSGSIGFESYGSNSSSRPFQSIRIRKTIGTAGTIETSGTLVGFDVELFLNLPENIFARDVVDDLDLFRGSRAVAHHDHRAVAGVLQRVKRAAGYERGLAGLERHFPAVRKAHRAFAVQYDESLIGVVAVHRVLLAWRVVMHPGVKPRRVKNVLTLFFLVRHIQQIDDFDTHEKSSLCCCSL